MLAVVLVENTHAAEALGLLLAAFLICAERFVGYFGTIHFALGLGRFGGRRCRLLRRSASVAVLLGVG